jgi:hypothetical protein
MSAIDRVFGEPTFGLDHERRRALLLAAMQEAYRHHFENCEIYARFCRRRGLDVKTVFERLEDFPYLPTQAFKEFGDALCSTTSNRIHTRLQSSATSGHASTVLIDAETARRQVQALTSVIAATLGPKRRPFIICDVDPASGAPGALGARSAAVRGFLNLARESNYVLRADNVGGLEVMRDKLLEVMERLRSLQEPFAVFGFTYVLFADVMKPLLSAPSSPPTEASLIHIGGWKKLEDQRVSRDEFEQAAHHVFGVESNRIFDFYGFTEQMGVVYPAIGREDRIAPAFAEVIVRDPATHAPLPPGHEGLLQFLTPLPHSYPGISVITDDVGMILEDFNARADGLVGTRFRVTGRAKNAEVRGCGDVMAEKMVTRMTASSNALYSVDVPRLLFFDRSYIDTADPMKPVVLSELPAIEIGALSEKLRKGREGLDAYTYDELATLIAAAARRWREPESGLDAFRQQGLLFLEGWCRTEHLARLGDEALRGARGYLDGFRPLGGVGRQVRAYPRGLVAHWLSGNVPLLGMLALTQSILSRNANILKSATTFSSALPALLESFRGLEVKTASDRVLKGDDVLKSIAVVYFSRENEAAGTAMSMSADVRVAWGGRDAVEAIGRLPRRYDTEDVMFGPKLSYMAIGREMLGNERARKRICRRVATDASVFDQYACASPHTIFVERGGEVSPRTFAEQLAREMAAAAVRIPKAPVDTGTAARITAIRLRHEFFGQVWSSPGTTWTVVYEEGPGQALPEACYSRVVFVRAVDDLLATADFASADIQTIGLGLSGERRQAYADRAAKKGAYRFPEIGRMTEFDSVWDGLYMMDRFVKWVSLGGPVT